MIGDKLENFEQILTCVEGKFAEIIARPIGQTKGQLCQRLLSLEESGPKALLAAVSLAGQGGVGSKVILCTDGIANVELGSLDLELEIDAADGFYQRVGEIAKRSGVGISVV